MSPEAHQHLRRQDPVMRRLIQEVGPCKIRPLSRSPFEALVRAIAHQQLNGKAADTITRRFLDLFPGQKFPTPEAVVGIDSALIRGAGFSQSKVLAILDIATKAQSGIVPSRRVLSRLQDQEIIDRLVECRGVGQWTVEMFLIFTLGRPDVLPVEDFGVRNGFRLAYGHEEMPKPAALREFGERWKPYRTTATWYLWRAVDLAKSQKA